MSSGISPVSPFMEMSSERSLLRPPNPTGMLPESWFEKS